MVAVEQHPDMLAATTPIAFERVRDIRSCSRGLFSVR